MSGIRADRGLFAAARDDVSADPVNGLDTWVTNRGYPIYVDGNTVYKIAST